MRIGNPPPIDSSTVQISSISAPTGFASLTTVSLATFTTTTISALTDQQELIISNLSTTGALYVMDTAETAGNVGLRIGPLAIASLNVNATVKLYNSDTTTLLVGIVQTTV